MAKKPTKEQRRRWDANWRARNPDRVRKLNRAAVRKWRLKHKYGLEMPDVEALLLAQGGKCPGCGSTNSREGERDWSVDHCHVTGRVRGILCADCNTTLGFARDRPETLRRLADYLEG